MERFETPEIFDYGSIADHTFTRSKEGPCGQPDPPKDWRPCKLDKFCEWSCES